MCMIKSRYETQSLLEQYLLFHYGSASDQLPFSFGPKDSLHFPVRCVAECHEIASLKHHGRALELGCAVGRTSFELARLFSSVLAIDDSEAFITAAKHIQVDGELPFRMAGEAGRFIESLAKRPEGVDPKRIEFRCEDAMNMLSEGSPFDLVLAANLICRLPDPSGFLSQLHRCVGRGGLLILASPYSWLEEFTPKEMRIEHSLEGIREILNPWFVLERFFDLPLLIREHYRKYEWVVAQVSIWRR